MLTICPLPKCYPRFGFELILVHFTECSLLSPLPPIGCMQQTKDANVLYTEAWLTLASITLRYRDLFDMKTCSISLAH
jgi:hypothetical protein